MATNVLRPISFSGGIKSISDDDLCAQCKNCEYRPGDQSGCKKSWPGLEDANGYVQVCGSFGKISGQDLKRGDAVVLNELPTGYFSSLAPLTVGNTYDVVDFDGNNVITTTDVPGETSSYHRSRVTKVGSSRVAALRSPSGRCAEDNSAHWAGRSGEC